MRSRISLMIVLMLVSHLFFGCKSATEPEIPPTSPFGSLAIQVNPDNSLLKLKLSGTLLKQRTGSGVIDSLLPGSYTLEASADNYYSDTSIVQIGANNRTVKNVQLTTSVGSLFIQVNVESALLELIKDGLILKQRTGSGLIDNLSPGTYILVASAVNYYNDTSIVQITINNRVEKSIQLIAFNVQMISIPAGTFTMGCTSEQSGCYGDETPAHQVTLSAYEIRKYEVTQIEWRTVMGTSPSYFTGGNKPVEQVSWNDAIKFCNTLSTRQGLTPVYTVNGTSVTANWSANGYRLPTEAEWEYAARGGASSTNTIYSGSNNVEDVAWISSNSGDTSHDVGTKAPNQLGIYDMSGNVWEWCWDWHSENYYGSSSQTNPIGPSSGSIRVYRGGSLNRGAEYCRVAFRGWLGPDSRNRVLGFRVVRKKN